jgi:hypothetical protein
MSDPLRSDGYSQQLPFDAAERWQYGPAMSFASGNVPDAMP